MDSLTREGDPVSYLGDLLGTFESSPVWSINTLWLGFAYRFTKLVYLLGLFYLLVLFFRCFPPNVLLQAFSFF